MTLSLSPAGGGGPSADLPGFYHLHSHYQLGSTNDEARELAEHNAPEGTVVWALEQDAGRGRRGREWVSPPGNLYTSLLLRPHCSPAAAAQLSFVTALALHATVAQAIGTPDRVRLKWPNDVLIAGRKVAGILLESHAGGGVLDWVIVGTGLNVISFPPEAERPATSLAAEGEPAGVNHVLEDYAGHFLGWYRRWLDNGFAEIRAEWLKLAYGLGGPIEVRLAHEQFNGVFQGLDPTGALIVDTQSGRRVVAAGDVYQPVDL